MDRAEYKEKLAPDFYLVKGPGKAKFPFCNSFLIEGKQRILIDAGAGEKIIRDLDREKRIDILLITHSHPDHILASHILKDRHLILPKETDESVHDLFELGKRFTGSKKGAEHWMKWNTERYGLQPLPIPDSRFGYGDILELGGICLEAIHVPGHLKDHYAFFDRQNRLLLTTDIDFTGFGPWYGHDEADIKVFIEDVIKLSNIEADIACSSHKPPVRSKIREHFNAFLECFKRQQQDVLVCCQSPVTLDEIVEQSHFYQNRFPNPFLQELYEKNIIKKNLDLLVQEKQLVLSQKTYLRITEETHEDH